MSDHASRADSGQPAGRASRLARAACMMAGAAPADVDQLAAA